MQTCPQPQGSAISSAQPHPIISHLDHLSPGLPKPGQDWTPPQGNPPKAPIATGIKRITFIPMSRPHWVALCPLSLSPLFPSQDLCTHYFLCLGLSFQGRCLLCSSLRSNLTLERPSLDPSHEARHPHPGPSVMPSCVHSFYFIYGIHLVYCHPVIHTDTHTER